MFKALPNITLTGNNLDPQLAQDLFDSDYGSSTLKMVPSSIALQSPVIAKINTPTPEDFMNAANLQSIKASNSNLKPFVPVQSVPDPTLNFGYAALNQTLNPTPPPAVPVTKISALPVDTDITKSNKYNGLISAPAAQYAPYQYSDNQDKSILNPALLTSGFSDTYNVRPQDLTILKQNYYLAPANSLGSSKAITSEPAQPSSVGQSLTTLSQDPGPKVNYLLYAGIALVAFFLFKKFKK